MQTCMVEVTKMSEIFLCVFCWVLLIGLALIILGFTIFMCIVILDVIKDLRNKR